MTMSGAVKAFKTSFIGRGIAQRLSPAWKKRIKQIARQVGMLPPAFNPQPGEAIVSNPAATGVVQSHWDQSAREGFLRDMTRRSWGGIDRVHDNHNYLVTGRRDHYWIAYMRDRYFKNGFAGDTLSLGCGEGHVDRTIHKNGFRFRSFTGNDISPASVQKAQELADAIPLSPKTHYYVADLNTHELPKNAYDFVFYFHSLHHIENVEFAVEQCAKTLRPGGLLMVNEFVGPSRMQWTAKQVEMADKLLNMLPVDLRYDLQQNGNVLKTKSLTPTVEDMIAGDPSEAARSADIDRVLKEHFEIIEEKNWGGTLNYLIFENIAGNFDPKNPWHECIVELLIEHENQMIQNKVLPSDFKFYMARPKRK